MRVEVGGQVPAEQVGPECAAGRRIGGDHLTHGEHAAGQGGFVPLAPPRVQRVAAQTALILGEQAVQRARATPRVGRVVDRPPPPRLVPRDESRAGREHGVVYLGQLGQRGPGFGDPQPQLHPPVAQEGISQRALAPVQGEVRVPHRAAVAVPGVDHGLGRPQHRERLAAVAHVVQLLAHHAAQDAAPPVRGEHRDPRHPGRRQRPVTRHAQLVGIDGRRADQLPAVEGREGPVELQRGQGKLPVALGQR